MQRLGLVAVVVVVAAAAGGLVGWQFPWVASALAAAVLAVLAGGGWWLRGRIAAIRKQQQRTQHLLESMQRQQKAAAAKASAADKAQRAEAKRGQRELAKAVQDRTNLVAKRIDTVAAKQDDRSRRQADRMFRQQEALQNLYQLVPVRRAMPATRGWALSPDILLGYVEDILGRRPRTVLECGSGVSTVWAAYALQQLGAGRVVALDHEAEFADKTRGVLADHGLSDVAEVRHAPITPLTLPDSGGEWHWYDTAALKDLHEVDLVLIDGPPKPTQEQARYPALPVLRDLLAPGAVLLLDDAARPDEQAILQRWLAEWPGLTSTKLPHEKGAARLVVPGA